MQFFELLAENICTLKHIHESAHSFHVDPGPKHTQAEDLNMTEAYMGGKLAFFVAVNKEGLPRQ